MINYSIFRKKFIFKDWDQFEPKYEIIELENGLKLQVENINGKKMRVNQVISTNPEDYLNGKIAPGSILNVGIHLTD